jgi:hypothetical protein
MPLRRKQGPQRTGPEVTHRITTGADHRTTGQTVLSASNKGHGQVSHVEARVESEVEPIHNPLTFLQAL